MVKEKNILKTIARSGALAFTLLILSDLVGILTTLILTRYLGVHQFGIYALALSIIQISSKLSMLGVQNGVLRFFPLYREHTGQLKGLMIAASSVIITGALMMTALLQASAQYLAISVFNEPGFETPLRLFALVLPLIVYSRLVSSLYQADKNVFKYLAFNDLFQKIVFIIFLMIMTLWGIKLMGALLLFMLSVGVVFVLAVIAYKTHFFPLIKGATGAVGPRLKELLHFSIPSFLIGFSYVLLVRVDRIMIGAYMDTSAVGIYVVSAKIALIMNIILASFNTIFVPYISTLFTEKKQGELVRVFQMVTKWTWALSIGLFGFLFFMVKPILSVFGKDFSGGWVSLLLMAFFFLLNCGFGATGFLLQMTGKPYLELANCTGALIMNILLNIILIPVYGIEGAALATGLSLLLVNIVRLFEIFALFKIHPFSISHLKVSFAFILSGLIAIGVNYLLPIGVLNQIISFVVFGIIFSVFLFFYGLGEESRFILNRIKKQIGILQKDS